MSTELKIRNLLGTEDRQIDFEPGVTVVHGPNAAGKTTIAVALSAITAFRNNPLRLPTATGKRYIRNGAAEGFAQMGKVEWVPMKSVSAPESEEPASSPLAVGCVDFTATHASQSARMRIWESLFLPDTVRELLEPHWSASDAELASLVDLIEESGWDAAEKNYEGQRRHAQSTWTTLTGERWGQKKAANWTPPNWREELAKESRASLGDALTAARAAKEALVGQQAVTQEQVERGKHIADVLIPEVQEQIDKHEVEIARVEELKAETASAQKEKKDEFDKVVAEGRRLRAIVDAKPQTKCPACDTGLDIVDGQAKIWEASQEDIPEALKKIASLKTQAQKLKADYGHLASEASEFNSKHMRLQQGLMNVKAQFAQLQREADAAPTEVAAAADTSEIDAAENKVGQAITDEIAFRAWHDANVVRDNVQRLQDTCNLLGPAGVRAKIMDEGMKRVRNMIAFLCVKAGWAPVEILKDFQIVSGQVPMALASCTEKLKAQWLCQIASAIVSQSTWIVLDNADHMKGQSWTGMVYIINALSRKYENLHFVICCAGDPDGVPETWHLEQIG